VSNERSQARRHPWDDWHISMSSDVRVTWDGSRGPIPTVLLGFLHCTDHWPVGLGCFCMVSFVKLLHGLMRTYPVGRSGMTRKVWSYPNPLKTHVALLHQLVRGHFISKDRLLSNVVGWPEPSFKTPASSDGDWSCYSLAVVLGFTDRYDAAENDRNTRA